MGVLFPRVLVLVALAINFSNAFTTLPIGTRPQAPPTHPPAARATPRLRMANVTEKEAASAIDKVVAALRKDKAANRDLGRLTQTNNVLGFGAPRPGTIAVRFNASFRKGGMGRSAVPLPFGLGQSDKAEGRGTMVGQVKASVDAGTGKVLAVSVFRDLGYGRSFDLKIS